MVQDYILTFNNFVDRKEGLRKPPKLPGNSKNLSVSTGYVAHRKKTMPDIVQWIMEIDREREKEPDSNYISVWENPFRTSGGEEKNTKLLSALFPVNPNCWFWPISRQPLCQPLHQYVTLVVNITALIGNVMCHMISATWSHFGASKGLTMTSTGTDTVQQINMSTK